ncbi:MAG TPA: hypothetical protein VMT61_08885 [Candidatus Binataceae bacterium]|nr:hypothetical protein [Candidatus Binataceae bacterium]
MVKSRKPQNQITNPQPAIEAITPSLPATPIGPTPEPVAEATPTVETQHEPQQTPVAA